MGSKITMRMLWMGLLGSITVMPVLILPNLVGSVVDEFGFTETQASTAASFNFIAGAIIALFMAFKIRSLNLKTVAIASLLLAAVSDFLSGYTGDNIYLFMTMRALAGLGQGAAYTALMSSIARTDDPDRGYGMLMTMQFGISALGLYLIPMILPISGIQGMFTGLSLLQFFGYYLKRTHNKDIVAYDPVQADHRVSDMVQLTEREEYRKGDVIPFDIFNKVSRAEWDTLFFFYGVVLCVGGLGFIGYLNLVSDVMYNQWGATTANVSIGFLSAIVDNIPLMFAVLSMNPEMSQGQWLLATLTAGVGGSMLSIGSAAGVALMGMAKGKYTFFGHLKWAPVIALGYAASIAAHMWINAGYF